MANYGRLVLLNGVSRAGKSSIARAMQAGVPGTWIHLGIDAHKACTPPSLQPGVGLRPGPHQVSPEVEAMVPVLYAALYESLAAHVRLGIDVVADVNHHDSYTGRYEILRVSARRVAGLPVLFVGVRCPLDEIWTRREATWGQVRGDVTADIVAAVELAQTATHAHGCYDIEVDTSSMSPEECAEVINRRLVDGPAGSAFERLAQRA